MLKNIVLQNEIEARDFAYKLGSILKGSEVIALDSDLGGGKTTLIKSIVAGTSSKDLVSSPTFTICNTYSSPKFTIYHYDFYRLSEPGIIERELKEAMNEKNSVLLIEWPKVIENILPKRTVHIAIKVIDRNKRSLIVDLPKELAYLVDDIK